MKAIKLIYETVLVTPSVFPSHENSYQESERLTERDINLETIIDINIIWNRGIGYNRLLNTTTQNGCNK